MRIESFYGEWNLESGIGRPRKNGWRKVKIYREPTGKYRTLKTGQGLFVKVPTRRNVYALAWNGSRLAKDKELAALKEKYPDMVLQIIKTLKQGVPTLSPPPPLEWVKTKFPELFVEECRGEPILEFEGWQMFLRAKDAEWTNYVLVRAVKVAKGQGRNIFHVSHNGERFARQAAMAPFKALYPDLFEKVERFLSGGPK